MLADFDIPCTLYGSVSRLRPRWSALPRLRNICAAATRYDTVDVATHDAAGVQVSNTPASGSGAGGVIELTWALILWLARDLAVEGTAMREGGRQHALGTTSRGKRRGTVGLGGIGTERSRIGRPF